MKMIPTKNRRWSWLAIYLLVVALLLSGCGGPTAQVAMAEPVTSQAKYDSYEIKNCGGAVGDLHEPVVKNFAVQQEVILAEQATAVAGGATYPLTESEKKSLAEQVKQAYAEKYAAAQAELEKQEFVAPQDRIATYSITWSEQVHKSTLEYEVNGEVRRVEYEYKLIIPQVGEMTLHICGG